MIGASLGPYKILEPLGAGGMGEVYLGEDTRLGRKVAIKVLPPEFASDPERLARFEQEARAAAALNHPHIAVVHDIGFEEGTGDEAAAEVATDHDLDLSADTPTGGVHYMVQEYLDGHTLRTPLDKGAMPLAKTLQLGTEIAEALAAAHGAGIVHRDLKPDNIFVTEEGHAKVLDFGLAKLTEVQITSSPGAGAAGASKSPTMLGTVAGQVMGTAGYMAPEQVHGEQVDHRADLFAFGCVLYQMVSGRQPFAGRSVLQTLDMIVNDEPPSLGELNVELPAQLHWILKKCLAKDPARRYEQADDLAIDLRSLNIEVESGTAVPAAAGNGEAATAATGAGQSSASSGPATSRGLSAAVTAAIVMVAVAATALVMRTVMRPVPPPTERFAIEVPPELALQTTGGGLNILQALDISADGRLIVYAAATADDPRPQLYLRRTSDYRASPIAGAQPGTSPFFSPDGEWIAFFDGNGMLKVPTTGGAPQRIGALALPLGATWAPDDNIYVAIAGAGLFKVPAAGGEAEQITPDTAPGASLYFPQLLPGGAHLLVTLWRDAATSTIGVLDLTDNSLVDLQVLGTNAHYVDSGHLVYAIEGSLFAVPFDLPSRTISGSPTPVLADVSTGIAGVTRFSIAAQSGTLVYMPGASGNSLRRLMWVDREGNGAPVSDEARPFLTPRVSPDGTRIAVAVDEAAGGAGQGVWIHELRTGTFTLLTTGSAATSPTWSADGEFVNFFESTGETGSDIYRRRADFTGEATPIVTKAGGQWPHSGAGDLLTLVELARGTGWDISVVSVDGQGTVEPFLQTTAVEGAHAVSPDGKWIAYISNESGRNQLYVQPFPDGGRRYTISTESGSDPVWSHDGTELYFRSSEEPDKMMVVDVTPGDEFGFSVPRLLFEAPYYDTIGRQYDVAPDGRFVTLETVGDATEVAARRINVVLNWFEELKQRVPTGR
ncbi:MAG: protein kinase [Acidobacteriota bacterium]